METQGTTIDATMQLDCVLTDPERDEAARELASGVCDLLQYEHQKQRVMDQWNTKIVNRSIQNQRLSNDILTGCGIREVECRIHLHHPEPGVKTIIRQDTLQVVETSEMTPDEIENHPCEQLTA